RRDSGSILREHRLHADAHATEAGGEDDDDGGQRHDEFRGDAAPFTPEQHHPPEVRALCTRFVRMLRTSSLRMITTRSPAKPTAAMMTMAYSAVAAPRSRAAHHRRRTCLP